MPQYRFPQGLREPLQRWGRKAEERRPWAETEVVGNPKFRYNADPSLSGVPLRQEEVDILILNGGKVLVKNEEAIKHFLARVGATLVDQRNRMTSLQHDVSRMSSERSTRAQPLARAMEAIAALTEEEKRQLLDASYLSEVDKLKRAQEEAQLEKTAAANETNRAKFAIASLLEDEALPPEARQRIANALAAMRRQGPPR